MAFYDSILMKTPNMSSISRNYKKRASLQFDYLYPTFIDEVLPHDTFHINQQNMARLAPMLAPSFGDVKLYTHFFFVPNRIIDHNWENFITEKHKGTDFERLDKKFMIQYSNAGFSDKLFADAFAPESYHIQSGNGQPFSTRSLADYLGIPSLAPFANTKEPIYLDLHPFLAYQKIFNDFYRDANLQEDLFDFASNTSTNCNLSVFATGEGYEQFLQMFQTGSFSGMKDHDNNDINTYADLTLTGKLRIDVDYNKTLTNNPYFSIDAWRSLMKNIFDLRKRCWRKDYFTAALPSLLHGEVPIVPVQMNNVAGPGSVIKRGDIYSSKADETSLYLPLVESKRDWTTNNGGQGIKLGFTISALRLANALQNFGERTMRGGTRYVEQLAAHFGVIASDQSIQRPLYIGGVSNEIYISEVTQTSESTDASAQGNYAGHAMTQGNSDDIYFTSDEHGFVIGITSVLAKPDYTQGLNKMFTREEKLDYYFPEFAALSEQPIKQQELYVLDAKTQEDFTCNPDQVTNNDVFGYTGRYDEYRVRNNEVSGEFRSGLNAWVFAREFGTYSRLATFKKSTSTSDQGRIKVLWVAPASAVAENTISYWDIVSANYDNSNGDLDISAIKAGNFYVTLSGLEECVPQLNADFVQSNVSKQPFAVTEELDPDLGSDYIFANFENQVTVIRAMPEQANPML